MQFSNSIAVGLYFFAVKYESGESGFDRQLESVRIPNFGPRRFTTRKLGIEFCP